MLKECHEIISSEAIEQINDIKRAYPQALIVPFKDFFQVMKDYNLATGRIHHYNGLIPEENIDQICNAHEAFRTLNLNRGFAYISSLIVDSDAPKRAWKPIVEYISRFPILYTYSNSFLNVESQKALQDNRKFINLDVERLYSEDWLIAAPVDSVPENTTIVYYSGREEARQARIKDPIVFKLCMSGVVIVSMWGEEADASIFDKYR